MKVATSVRIQQVDEDQNIVKEHIIWIPKKGLSARVFYGVVFLTKAIRELKEGMGGEI